MVNAPKSISQVSEAKKINTDLKLPCWVASGGEFFFLLACLSLYHFG